MCLSKASDGRGCCGDAADTSSGKMKSHSHSRCGDGKSKSISNFREYLLRTNVDLQVIGFLLASYHAHSAYASEDGGTEDHGGDDEHGGTAAAAGGDEHGEDGVHAQHAVLFPWFIQIIGVLAYYSLSRKARALPYTAIMFIIGILLGIALSLDKRRNAVTDSASLWVGIDGHVILLVFLPGLLYLDSYNVNVHMFAQSFWQLVVFAFPMVLLGTFLTALVAYYVLPYNWPMNLCMTFGSILAATDPVAVAVLLNELGAPPRLKMHISGESLLNDGSAVVFYIIFHERYFSELNIDGFGEDIGWGLGFSKFAQLAFGGIAIGLAFGAGTLAILYLLNRRLSQEENVAQVVVTITSAYLAFFVSEILAETSGILTVVFLGITVKAYGEHMINDLHLMHNFWHITEHLLNTLLFGLGGMVWGRILVEKSGPIDGTAWGFLFLLYILVIVIRFFLVFTFYPVTKQLGLGTSWQEAVFMSYGGLRGAVGIALALVLNAEVMHEVGTTSNPEDYSSFVKNTEEAFFLVGGIALLTLVVNGTTSGPLLRKLGLITPTSTRLKVVENFRENMNMVTLVEYIDLLSQDRFKSVDYSVVRNHVSPLKYITYKQLETAVARHKEQTPVTKYKPPNLHNVVPYLLQEKKEGEEDSKLNVDANALLLRRRSKSRAKATSGQGGRRKTFFAAQQPLDELKVVEERQVFIELLRSGYFHQVEIGYLEQRHFVQYSLFQSLEFAQDAASNGLPLNDWEAAQMMSPLRMGAVLRDLLRPIANKWKGKSQLKEKSNSDFRYVKNKVKLALSFIFAHEEAQVAFKKEFTSSDSGAMTMTEKAVLDESKQQVALAEESLYELDAEDVRIIKSHYVSRVLLNKSVKYFETLAHRGLLSKTEAGEFLEHFEEELIDLNRCQDRVHEGELSKANKRESLKGEVASDKKNSLNINEDDVAKFEETGEEEDAQV